MLIDLSTRSPGALYALMTQAILPRPVAWALTENATGTWNLAPFSYFMPIGSAPPMLAFSVGNRPGGGEKDTAANIAARGRFVVHIAHRELLGAVNDSAAPYPSGVSEVDALGLATVPFGDTGLPRLADARVAMACRRDQILELGTGPQHVVIAVIEHFWLADEIRHVDDKGRLRIDALALDPVARLGSREYGLLGDIVALDRPTTA